MMGVGDQGQHRSSIIEEYNRMQITNKVSKSNSIILFVFP